MVNVEIGKHYTYDNGKPQNKIIVFVTSKNKYENEDDYFYNTVSLLCEAEIVYETQYELDFFQNQNVRISTPEEIKMLRSYCPVDIEWIKNTMKKIVEHNWGINIVPWLCVDPNEPLERENYGSYDPALRTVIFRSEFLSLLSIDRIERVIAHELCHWYLHVTGEPFYDHDVRFAKEIIKLGLDDTINIHNPTAKEAYEKALQS
jgi:SprT-like protein